VLNWNNLKRAARRFRGMARLLKKIGADLMDVAEKT